MNKQTNEKNKHTHTQTPYYDCHNDRDLVDSVEKYISQHDVGDEGLCSSVRFSVQKFGRGSLCS